MQVRWLLELLGGYGTWLLQLQCGWLLLVLRDKWLVLLRRQVWRLHVWGPLEMRGLQVWGLLEMR